MPIKIYNIHEESHDNDQYNFIMTRPSVLSNPYTFLDIKKTRALFQCKNREETLDKYRMYFDTMYSGNKEFKAEVDMLYELYRRNENIYLGCVCAPLPCHCDIIVEKLQKRLIKEKIKELRCQKETNQNIK